MTPEMNESRNHPLSRPFPLLAHARARAVESVAHLEERTALRVKKQKTKKQPKLDCKMGVQLLVEYCLTAQHQCGKAD